MHVMYRSRDEFVSRVSDVAGILRILFGDVSLSRSTDPKRCQNRLNLWLVPFEDSTLNLEQLGVDDMAP